VVISRVGRRDGWLVWLVELGVPKLPPRLQCECECIWLFIAFNLCRRHLDPVRWGQAFLRLCEERGATFGEGGDRRSNSGTAATIAGVAKETGVSERTARSRVAQARQYEALPAKQRKAVDSST
jgi:hypothetical protein